MVREKWGTCAGQSLIELALILPLLLVVAAGLLSIWRVAHFRLTLLAAARHGAVVEARDGDGQAAARDYLKRSLDTDYEWVDSVQAYPGWPLAKITVSGQVRLLLPGVGPVAVTASSGVGRSLLGN